MPEEDEEEAGVIQSALAFACVFVCVEWEGGEVAV